jgi:hypothetical protein
MAQAWHLAGCVYCDANHNGVIDAEDTPLVGAQVVVRNTAGTFVGVDDTGNGGCYYVRLPDVADSYTATIDAGTLPPGAVIVSPASGQYDFTLESVTRWLDDADFLVECGPRPQGCWLTAGGVKFSPITGTDLAEKGPQYSFGGNVFPGCDPDPGEGGQWNHIAHALKLHFQGWSIHTVSCGNVPGIEPGSESPVTPFNYIEFEGTGTLKGIKGNKTDYGAVTFFARCEDRNEPGSRGANDGVDIDRYFLRVKDGSGIVRLLIDLDGDPNTVDPVTITGGNLQLHISSCDDPPAP